MNKVNCIWHGKKIGEIRDNFFFTHRTEKHFFHMIGDGLGLSEDVVDFIKKHGAEYWIVEFENGEQIYASIEILESKGEPYTDTSMGYEDRQIILPRKYFVPFRSYDKYEVIKVK